MWCGTAGGADITCFWCCHTENAFARARWSDRPPEMAAKRAFTAAAGCLRDGSVGSTQGSLRGRGPACLSDACCRAWFFAVIVRVSGYDALFRVLERGTKGYSRISRLCRVHTTHHVLWRSGTQRDTRCAVPCVAG